MDKTVNVGVVLKLQTQEFQSRLNSIGAKIKPIEIDVAPNVEGFREKIKEISKVDPIEVQIAPDKLFPKAFREAGKNAVVAFSREFQRGMDAATDDFIDKLNTKIGDIKYKVNIEISSNVGEIESRLSKLSADPINVELTADTKQFQQQIKQVSTEIDCIKVDLCPNVDDFKEKIKRIERLTECLSVDLCVNVDSFQNKVKQITVDPIKVDLSPDVADFQEKLRRVERISSVQVQSDIAVDFSEVKSKFRESGRYAVIGFAEGFFESGGAVKQAIDSMIESVDQQLGIQSPSTVFRKTGKYSGQGFSEGFKNSVEISFNSILGQLRSRIGALSLSTRVSVSIDSRQVQSELNRITANIALNPPQQSKPGETVNTKELSESIGQSVKQGIKDSSKTGILGGLFGMIAAPVKMATSAIAVTAAGAALKIGSEVSGGLASGLKDSLGGKLSGVIGSGNLLGEAIGERIAESAASALAVLMPDTAKKVSNALRESVGTEKVAIASAIERSRDTGFSDKEVRTASEQVKKEFEAIKQARLPEKAKELQQRINNVAPRLNQEIKEFEAAYKQAQEKLWQEAESIVIKLTPERLVQDRLKEYQSKVQQYASLADKLEQKGEIGKAFALRSAASQVARPDTDTSKISESELKLEESLRTSKARQDYVLAGTQSFVPKKVELDDARTELNKKVQELRQIQSQIDNAMENIALVGVESPKQKLPDLYKQIVQAVAEASGVAFSAEKMPSISVGTDEQLRGATAGYNASANEVVLRSDLASKIQSGDALSLLDSEIATLVHELRHAVQVDFGGVDVYQGEAAKVELLRPSSEDLTGRMAQRVQASSQRKSTEEQRRVSRDIEFDAYLFEAQQAAGITENIKKNALKNRVYEQFGVGGSIAGGDVKAATKSIIPRFTEAAKSLQEMGLNPSAMQQEGIAAIELVNRQIKLLQGGFADIESMDSDQLSAFISETESSVQTMIDLVSSVPRAMEELLSSIQSTIAASQIDESDPVIQSARRITPESLSAVNSELRNESDSRNNKNNQIQSLGKSAQKAVIDSVKEASRSIFAIQEAFQNLDLSSQSAAAVSQIQELNSSLSGLFQQIANIEKMPTAQVDGIESAIQESVQEIIKEISTIPENFKQQAIKINNAGQQFISAWDLSQDEYIKSVEESTSRWNKLAQEVDSANTSSSRNLTVSNTEIDREIAGLSTQPKIIDEMEELRSQVVSSLRQEELEPIPVPEEVAGFNKDLFTDIFRMVASLSGVDVSPEQVPSVQPIRRELEEEGALGAYSFAENAVMLPSKSIESLQKGVIELELLGTLIHELRHAMQSNLGEINPIDTQMDLIKANAIEQDQLFGQIVGSVEGSFGKPLEQIDPRNSVPMMNIEEDAYTFEKRNKGRFVDSLAQMGYEAKVLAEQMEEARQEVEKAVEKIQAQAIIGKPEKEFIPSKEQVQAADIIEEEMERSPGRAISGTAKARLIQEKSQLKPLADAEGFEQDTYTNISRLVALLSGIEITPEQIPAIAQMPKHLERIGAVAGYDSTTNQIQLNSQSRESLESGKIDNDLLNTLIHELRHAVQSGFGATTPSQTDAELLALTENEVLTYVRRVFGSVEGAIGRPIDKTMSPEDRLDVQPLLNIEFDAYAFADIVQKEIKKALELTDKARQVNRDREIDQSVINHLQALDTSESTQEMAIASRNQAIEIRPSGVNEILAQIPQVKLPESDKANLNFNNSAEVEAFLKQNLNAAGVKDLARRLGLKPQNANKQFLIDEIASTAGTTFGRDKIKELVQLTPDKLLKGADVAPASTELANSSELITQLKESRRLLAQALNAAKSMQGDEQLAAMQAIASKAKEQNDIAQQMGSRFILPGQQAKSLGGVRSQFTEIEKQAKIATAGLTPQPTQEEISAQMPGKAQIRQGLEIARNIADGIGQGTEESSGDIAESAGNLTNNFVDTIEKGFGIASPSKVMTQVGRYLGQGVQIGGEESMAIATQKITEKAKNIITAVQSVFKTAVNPVLLTEAEIAGNDKTQYLSGESPKSSSPNIASPSISERLEEMERDILVDVAARTERLQELEKEINSPLPELPDIQGSLEPVSLSNAQQKRLEEIEAKIFQVRNTSFPPEKERRLQEMEQEIAELWKLNEEDIDPVVAQRLERMESELFGSSLSSKQDNVVAEEAKKSGNATAAAKAVEKESTSTAQPSTKLVPLGVGGQGFPTPPPPPEWSSKAKKVGTALKPLKQNITNTQEIIQALGESSTDLSQSTQAVSTSLESLSASAQSTSKAMSEVEQSTSSPEQDTPPPAKVKQQNIEDELRELQSQVGDFTENVDSSNSILQKFGDAINSLFGDISFNIQARKGERAVAEVRARQKQVRDSEKFILSAEINDDPMARADAEIKELQEKQARKAKIIQEIISDPLGFIQQRSKSAVTQKARYSTENASQIVDLVGSRIGKNPTSNQAVQLAELSRAFDELGKASAEFGQNESPETFGAMNEAIKQFESTLSSLGMPFDSINKEIAEYRKNLEEMQGQGIIAPEIDIDALIPEEFPAFDLLISKFQNIEIAGMQSLKTITGVVGGFASLAIAGFLQDKLASLGQDAFQAYVELDRLKTSLNFSSGGINAGARNLEFVRQTVDDLRVPLRASIEGFTELAAAARGSSLQGEQTRELFLGLSQASSVLSLDAEKSQRAITALSQSISKGRIQSEEIRLQLGDSIPGAIGLAARAAGTTVEEFNRLMESGQVLSEDFLPKFSRQLQAEFGEASKGAAQNAQSALFAVENATLSLQQNLGEAIAPSTVVGLNLLSFAINAVAAVSGQLAIALTSVATVLSIKMLIALKSVVAQMIATKAVTGTLSGGIQFLAKTVNNSFSAIATVGIFALLEGIRQLNSAVNTELVTSFNNAAKSAQNAAEQSRKAFDNAKGEKTGETRPISTSGTGRFLDKYLLGALNLGNENITVGGAIASGGRLAAGDFVGAGRMIAKGQLGGKATTYGQLEQNRILDAIALQQQGIVDLRANANLRLAELRTGSGQTGKLKGIDSQLVNAQERRQILKADIERNFTNRGLTTPAETRNQMEELNAQIKRLNDARAEISEPFTLDISRAETQINSLTAQIDALKTPEAIANQGGEEAATKVRKELEATREGLRQFKNEMESSLASLRVDPVLTFTSALEQLNLALNKSRELTENDFNVARQMSAADQAAGFYTNRFASRNASLQNAINEQTRNEREVAAQREAVNALDAAINAPELQASFQRMNVSPQSTVAEIDFEIGRAADDVDKAMLEQLKSSIQERNQLTVATASLAESTLNLNQSQQDFFLASIQDRTDEITAEITKQQNIQAIAARSGVLTGDISEETASEKMAQLEVENTMALSQELQQRLILLRRHHAEKKIGAEEFTTMERQLLVEISGMEKQELENRIAFKESEIQQRSHLIQQGMEQEIALLSLARLRGLNTEEEFNELTFAAKERAIAKELGLLDDRMRRSPGVDELAKIQILEAQIYQKRLENQTKFLDDQLALLERHQQEAADLATISAKEREIELQKLVNARVLSQEEAQEETLKIAREGLEGELRLEREKLSKLQSLPPYSNPAAEEQRQEKIRQSRIRTSDLQLQLLENEKSQQEAAFAVVSRSYDRLSEAIANQATAAEQLFNKQLLASTALEKSLDKQNQLLDAQRNLRSSLAGYIDAQFQILLETAATEQEKDKLAEASANIKLQAALQQANIERQSLESQILQANLAQRRLEIENAIAQIRNRADVAQKEGDIARANADPDATPEQREAARLGLIASLAEGDALRQEAALLQQQRTVNEQVNEMKRQAFVLQSSADITRARFEAANAITDKQEKRKAFDRLRRGAGQDLFGRNPGKGLLPGELEERKAKEAQGIFYRAPRTEKRYIDELDRLNNRSRRQNLLTPLQTVRSQQIQEQVQNQIQRPVLPKLPIVEMPKVSPTLENTTRNLDSAIDSLVKLVDQKLSSPNAVTISTPINNYFTPNDTSRDAANSTTQVIRKELYDLGIQLKRR